MFAAGFGEGSGCDDWVAVEGEVYCRANRRRICTGTAVKLKSLALSLSLGTSPMVPSVHAANPSSASPVRPAVKFLKENTVRQQG